MSNEPFQMPRRPSHRNEPEEVVETPSRPVDEEPRRTVSEPKVATRTRKAYAEKKSKTPLIIAVAVAVLVVVGIAVWALWPKGTVTTIDTNKYQAVSFTDGQLYFGKLSNLNDQNMKLTDIYYLQPQTDDTAASKNVQNTTSTNQNFKLIKFTDVIYGPEDEMTIPKSQILFYENLKPNGKVAQLIQQFKKSN